MGNQGKLPRSGGPPPSTQALEYTIADKVVIPPDSEDIQAFSEHIVYLPGSYQPQDEVRQWMSGLTEESFPQHGHFLAVAVARQEVLAGIRPVTELPSPQDSMAAKHLERMRLLSVRSSTDATHVIDDNAAAKALWIICFNRLSKVTPDAFQDWMQAMSRLPQSVLLLMAESPVANGAILVRK